MATRDKILLAAICASAVLHIVALFGTPRFDLAWLYEDTRPAPIEVRIVVREPQPPPPARVVAATAARPLARKPARRAPAPPAPAAPPAAIESATALEPPSPDGEPLPPVAQAGDAPGAPAAADTVAARAPDTPREPATTPEPAAAEYPLEAVRLVFDLYYGRYPTKVGQVTHTWTQDGQHYAAESVAEAVGFISFFFGGRFVQRSVGQLGRTGLVPDEYTLERGGRGDKPEIARFDWGEGKLALAWKGESRLVDLPAGAQDPLSALHQLYFMKPIPAAARFAIASGRKLNQYVYQRVGEETLETPLGMLATLHFRRQEPDGTLMDVWVDRDRDLLPVRIHLVDRKGAVLDQVIREARTELRELPTAEW